MHPHALRRLPCPPVPRLGGVRMPCTSTGAPDWRGDCPGPRTHATLVGGRGESWAKGGGGDEGWGRVCVCEQLCIIYSYISVCAPTYMCCV